MIQTKIIPQNVATGIRCFDLPIHPHCVMGSTCPQCGGVGYPDDEMHGAYLNFGTASEPSVLSFTCYNYLPNGDVCEHQWEDSVIIRVTLELPILNSR